MNVKKLIAVVIIVVIALAGFAGLDLLGKREDRKRTESLTEEPVQTFALEYEGNTYTLRDGIDTYLLLGTDETTESAAQLEGRNINNKQADFIMLMIVDKTNGVYNAMHLNRDTYMEIRRLDENGNPDGFITAHLNNAHSYGSGGKDSCRNVVEAVSRLLSGMPIEHYLAITMDGIPILADLVDGVPVTLEEDLTNFGSKYVKGATVILRGQDALQFVRVRMSVSDGTNLMRMTRQRAFMTSLYERLESKLKEDEFPLRLTDGISPYVTSDLTTNELARLADQLKGYRFVSIQETKGDAYVDQKTGYMDYYVNANALKEQLINLALTPKKAA